MTTCTRPRCDRAVKIGHILCHRHLYSEGIFKHRVPVAPVRAHLRRCIDQGANVGGIATGTGVPYVTTYQAAGLNPDRDQTGIARNTAEKLMQARPDMIGHWVPSWPYQRRLQALRAAGHTVAVLAEQCALSPCAVSYISTGTWTTIGVRTAERIDQAYEVMSAWPVGKIAPRTLAHGWAPPMAWSDIDDPGEDHTPPPNSVQAAGPVIAAMLELVAEYGMEGAAEAAGVSRETIRRPVTGEGRFLLTRSALAILRAQSALHRKAVAA